MADYIETEHGDTISSLVPEQRKGSETGARHEVQLTSRVMALELFKRAKQRLLDVNRWQQLAGEAGATFELCDAHGAPLRREARIDDLIKIDLPGPGTLAGDGFDWVRIDAIEDKSNPMGEHESFSLRTRPVKNPMSDVDAPAHFYTGDASSTFVVERDGDKLIALEVGNNEVINFDVPKVRDKIRNAAVATGSRVGVSALQWKSLLMGLIDDAVVR